MLAALLLLTASSARAIPTLPGCNGPQNPENAAILAVNNSVSVGYLNSNLDYLEPSDGDAFDTGLNFDDYEKASLNGVQLTASWMGAAESDLYAHVEWDWASGTADYTGVNQTFTELLSGLSGAIIQNYSARLGKGFVTAPRWMLTPYAEFGGRHWLRTIGEGTSGDFNETYQHYYAGAGTMLQYADGGRWVVTGDATLARTFYAWINVPDSGLDHAPLGNAPLLKLGLEADARITDLIHAFARFRYSYFTYGQSDLYLVPNTSPQLVAHEPISRTQMFDATVGVRFAY